MSILIAKTRLAELPIERLFEVSGNKDYFKEIGLCFNFAGGVERRTGFNTLSEVHKYIHQHELESCLIYANNPSRSFNERDFSPQIVTPQYAFASCGDMLTLKFSDSGRSNCAVFSETVLTPAGEAAPDIFRDNSFAWMMRRIAREYIGMAFLSGTGHITLINGHLFKMDKGVYTIDFESTKRAVIQRSVNRRTELRKQLAVD